MRAVEFDSTVSNEGKLAIPSGLAAELPCDRKVRVILLFPEIENHDADWSRLTATQFLSGYAPGDAIYDQE